MNKRLCIHKAFMKIQYNLKYLNYKYLLFELLFFYKRLFESLLKQVTHNCKNIIGRTTVYRNGMPKKITVCLKYLNTIIITVFKFNFTY